MRMITNRVGFSLAILATAITLSGCLGEELSPEADPQGDEEAPPADEMEAATDVVDEAAPADDPDVAAASAAAVDHSRTIAVGPKGGNGSAEATWRDYGNGYIQFKSGVCRQNLNLVNSCKYVLRADGGRTTFHTWSMPLGKKVVNGKYTIAKSRHPYIKVFVKPPVGSSYIGYIHLY